MRETSQLEDLVRAFSDDMMGDAGADFLKKLDELGPKARLGVAILKGLVHAAEKWAERCDHSVTSQPYNDCEICKK